MTEQRAPKPITIRRDGTFEYRGVRYQVSQGSDTPTLDGSRFIVRINSDVPGDWDMVADSFGYMREVREFLAQAQDEGWDDLDVIAASAAHSDQRTRAEIAAGVE